MIDFKSKCVQKGVGKGDGMKERRERVGQWFVEREGRGGGIVYEYNIQLNIHYIPPLFLCDR